MEYQNSWYEEKRSAYMYHILAENESSVLQKKMFQDLAVAALKQAGLWEAHMQRLGITIPVFKPDFRLRLVSVLIKIFGSYRLRRVLSAMKIRGMSALSVSHYEHQHIAPSSANNIRAAVFGINDGLVSNMSLILGLVGAHVDVSTIIVAGTAGLLAGAASMAAGEYISVKSQRELFEYQIDIERQELEEYPEEEKAELSLIYEARGIAKKDADMLANLMIDNPKIGLDTLAREELGLNPDDIVSPIGAMLASFIAFTIGAFLPLLPFILWHDSSSIWISAGISAFSLFATGMILSLFSSTSGLWSGLRMLLVGTLAGVITYAIGSLLGVSLG